MTSARRHYLYLVALVGLLVTLLGTLASIELGVRLVLLPGAATAGLFPRFAVAAGLAAAGLLLWLSHWLMANSVAGNLRMGSAIERQAPVRKAYFHLGRLVALFLAAWRIVFLINDVLLIVLGTGPASLPDWPTRPVAAVLGAGFSLLIWSYLRNSALLDADFGHEVGGGAVWRRSYYYLGVGAAMLVFALGAGELMRAFWRLGAQGVYFDAPLDTPWREAAAASAALAAVGLPLATLLWQRANSLVTTTVAARIELNATGRKLLEYAGALIGAEATIACIFFLLYQGLRLLLGFRPDDERSYWESQWVTPLAYLPVAIFLWRTGWRQARGDMEWIGESADAATLRQFHFYLLAAVGLAALWYGLHGALVALVLVIAGVQPPAMLGNPAVRDYVSRALALLVIGAPVWWGHWRVQHGFAREQSQEGYWERTLLLRRLYLYAVIAAAVITGAAALVRVALRTPGTPGRCCRRPGTMGGRAAGGIDPVPPVGPVSLPGTARGRTDGCGR